MKKNIMLRFIFGRLFTQNAGRLLESGVDGRNSTIASRKKKPRRISLNIIFFFIKNLRYLQKFYRIYKKVEITSQKFCSLPAHYHPAYKYLKIFHYLRHLGVYRKVKGYT